MVDCCIRWEIPDRCHETADASAEYRRIGAGGPVRLRLPDRLPVVAEILVSERSQAGCASSGARDFRLCAGSIPGAIGQIWQGNDPMHWIDSMEQLKEGWAPPLLRYPMMGDRWNGVRNDITSLDDSGFFSQTI